MKKSLSALLCLLILFSIALSATAFAGYSFKDMSQAEIVQVAAGLNDELIRRYLVEQVEIPAGRYTVGEDIPAGDYRITISSGYAYLSVWGSEYNNFDDDGGLLLSMVLNAESKETKEIGKAVLKDGNVIDFDSALVFETYHGLGLQISQDKQP